MELKIGDLIQCRNNHYNQGLGIVDKIGMVVELRRKDIRTLFDVEDQLIWLRKNGVNRITLPPVEPPTLLDRLSWLIGFLDAEEAELDSDSSGNYQYTLLCGELTLEKIHSVRDYLQPLFVGAKVVPKGMSRLGLEIVFRRSWRRSK